MSLSTDSLKGKVCVITGAAKSIGLAIAVNLAMHWLSKTERGDRW